MSRCTTGCTSKYRNVPSNCRAIMGCVNVNSRDCLPRCLPRYRKCGESDRGDGDREKDGNEIAQGSKTSQYRVNKILVRDVTDYNSDIKYKKGRR